MALFYLRLSLASDLRRSYHVSVSLLWTSLNRGLLSIVCLGNGRVRSHLAHLQCCLVSYAWSFVEVDVFDKECWMYSAWTRHITIPDHNWMCADGHRHVTIPDHNWMCAAWTQTHNYIWSQVRWKLSNIYTHFINRSYPYIYWIYQYATWKFV